MPNVSRLFTQFIPAHYELTLRPDAQTMEFSGTVTISGTLPQLSSSVLLHAKDLTIVSAKLNNKDCKTLQLTQNDELRVKLPTKTKGTIQLDIAFSGLITKPMHGLYPCIGRDGGIILATQFESHHAREVFPCIDEPEAKATFDVSLITPASETVLSNTPVKTRSVTNERAQTTFETTPIMSTYLLAFVVGELHAKEATTKSGVVVRTWATADQAAFTDFALEVATNTLDFFNEYFAIPYPLDKCDLVALPDFASGAMENWGLITFRESCMLVDPANTSLVSKQYVAMVVAHELAHQWFGNLVTMRWWTDLWLNEGFASWIEYMAVDKLFPKWHMWTQFIADEQQAALRLDALKNTHPVEVAVHHPDEIRTIFDTISYSKGSSVIHMLHAYLGPKAFQKGLIAYLKKYAYSNAATTDLWHSLEQASGKPVEAFMATWTGKPGFPVVKVQQDSLGQLTLSQRQFFANPTEKGSKTTWQVPLLSNDIDHAILQDKKGTYTPPPDKLYKINRGQAGFYHTKYPQAHYKVLGEAIENSVLPELDRFGILADALALNKSGDLPLETLFDLLSHYSNESSAPVWDSIASLIADIRRVMGEDVREQIKPLVRALSKKQVARLGWHEQASESHFDKLLRPTVLGLAASADDVHVTRYAKQLFASAKSTEDIPANIRGVVLGSVSKRGTNATFKKLLRMYDATINPEDKVVLAAALTNFRTDTEFTAALALITSDKVRTQDIGYWVAYSLSNPFGRQKAWKWLQKNWTWLDQNLGADLAFSRFPMYAARVHSDEKFLQSFNNFFEPMLQLPTLERAIKQGQETIKSQIAWRKQDEAALLRWLNQ